MHAFALPNDEEFASEANARLANKSGSPKPSRPNPPVQSALRRDVKFDGRFGWRDFMLCLSCATTPIVREATRSFTLKEEHWRELFSANAELISVSDRFPGSVNDDLEHLLTMDIAALFVGQSGDNLFGLGIDHIACRNVGVIA